MAEQEPWAGSSVAVDDSVLSFQALLVVCVNLDSCLDTFGFNLFICYRQALCSDMIIIGSPLLFDVFHFFSRLICMV
jgi:hypothetical protein